MYWRGLKELELERLQDLEPLLAPGRIAFSQQRRHQQGAGLPDLNWFAEAMSMNSLRLPAGLLHGGQEGEPVGCRAAISSLARSGCEPGSSCIPVCMVCSFGTYGFECEHLPIPHLRHESTFLHVRKHDCAGSVQLLFVHGSCIHWKTILRSAVTTDLHLHLNCNAS